VEKPQQRRAFEQQHKYKRILQGKGLILAKKSGAAT
jgi:hypothetical protein